MCAQLKGEEAVRRGGLESYVVVRAAGLRESNDGVKKLVEIGQVRGHLRSMRRWMDSGEMSEM